MSPIIIRQNPERSRFEVLDAGTVIGRAYYVDREDDGLRIFYGSPDVRVGQGLCAMRAWVAR
ncbi:hypothetical protein [Arthrobacter sp. UYCu723]